MEVDVETGMRADVETGNDVKHVVSVNGAEHDGKTVDLDSADDTIVEEPTDGDAGEGTSTTSTSTKRRSTRIKKEVEHLHDDARFQPINRFPSDKPKSMRGPPFRFVRRLKRRYKTMNLVDKDWTIAERERLLDAVSKVDHDDFASMSAIIGPTKTEAEIRDYIRRIRYKTKEQPGFVDVAAPDILFGERPDPNSSHLTVNERGDPIERWLRVIDHLVADNETNDYSQALASVLSVIANFEQEQDVGKSGNIPQEPNADDNPNAVAPINFKLIYNYLYALLRGFAPPELDPIEAWVILDLISETASELKHSDLDPQKEYLRNIFRDFCLKVFNTRWSSTTRVGLDPREEEAVRKRRRTEEKKFRSYLAKGNVVEEEDNDEEEEEDESVIEEHAGGTEINGHGIETSSLSEAGSSQQADPGVASADVVLEEGGTSGAVGEPPEEAPGEATVSSEVPAEARASSFASTYHNIMIGGLRFASDAEDYGSLFPFNPLGVPISALKPKPKKS